MPGPHRLLGLMTAACLLLAACDDAPDPEASPTPAPTQTVEPKFVFYMLENQLLRFKIATKFSLIVDDLPTAEVAVSPDGAEAVFVQDSNPRKAKGGEYGEPILRIGPIEGRGLVGEALTLGPGFAPVWQPGGDLIAAQVKAGSSYFCPTNAGEVSEKNAEEAGCVLGERVVTYDRSGDPGQEGMTALGADLWGLVAWTEGERVVGASDRFGRSSLGFPGAVAEDIIQLTGLPPEGLLAVSPTALTALVDTDEGPIFVDTAEGSTPFGRRGAPIDLRGRIAGAEWSPDGETVAVIGPELSIVAVDSASAESVPGSRGVEEVVWGPDGSFVFERTSGKNSTVSLCTGPRDCEEIFFWDRAVRLVALTG